MPFIHFWFFFLFPSPMYSGLGGAGKQRQWFYAATRQCALWLVFRRSEAQQMLTMRNLIALNDSLTHSIEREALGPNSAQETCFPASSICLATLLSQSPQHTVQRSQFSPLHEVHIKRQPFLFLDCCHLNTYVLT